MKLYAQVHNLYKILRTYIYINYKIIYLMIMTLKGLKYHIYYKTIYPLKKRNNVHGRVLLDIRLLQSSIVPALFFKLK